jgi:hypothetical protein
MLLLSLFHSQNQHDRFCNAVRNSAIRGFSTRSSDSCYFLSQGAAFYSKMSTMMHAVFVSFYFYITFRLEIVFLLLSVVR